MQLYLLLRNCVRACVCIDACKCCLPAAVLGRPCKQRVQIDAIEAQLGASLLAKVELPGSNRKIQTHKLLALTGHRFIRAMTPTEAACDALERPCKQPRCESDRAAGDALAVPAAAADGPDNAALNCVADAINGDAPAKMTIAEAIAFARAASFCNADAVLKALPSYMLMNVNSTAMVRSHSCGTQVSTD